jgi:hypothetical protein
VLGTKDPISDEVSHGMCHDCREKMVKEIEELNDKTNNFLVKENRF